MKLTKAESRLHDETLGLVEASQQRRLSQDEQYFILQHYHPGAVSNITKSGAFFTPPALAEAAAFYHGGSGRVLDACAGIGMLAWHLRQLQPSVQLTCVEKKADYVKVGRAVLPDVEWIEGDITKVLQRRTFDSGLSNPPFGRIDGLSEPGMEAHFVVLSLLTKCCAEGAVVIVPDNCHSMQPNTAYRKFVHEHPGWDLVVGPFDMRCFKAAWKGADPKVSICNLEHV